jgi:hypothetical protein
MEMRAELRIDGRPGAAWAVVGEQFGRVGEWACPITDSSIEGPPGVGAIRTCRIAGFGPVGPGVITERLTLFDPAGRSLEYEAADGDALVHSAGGEPLVGPRRTWRDLRGPGARNPDVAAVGASLGSAAAVADARGVPAGPG